MFLISQQWKFLIFYQYIGTVGSWNLSFSFFKLFKDDIRYLLTMDKLWRKRKPPVPLDWAEVQSQGKGYILVLGILNWKFPHLKSLNSLMYLDNGICSEEEIQAVRKVWRKTTGNVSPGEIATINTLGSVLVVSSRHTVRQSCTCLTWVESYYFILCLALFSQC